MTTKAALYIYGVIAVGIAIITASLGNWTAANPTIWVSYVVLAGIASIIKLRLPGLEGTYSLGFLFSMFGIAQLSFAETLVATCFGALLASVLNVKKRPAPIQVAFNVANASISAAAGFFLARVWLASGMTSYRPAVMALVACAYFMVNTSLVSGVLVLVAGKRLTEVSEAWYLWSLPYYLIGSTLVGLISISPETRHPEAWLILVPLVYLVHFLIGLLEFRVPSGVDKQTAELGLPPAAGFYARSMAFAGVLLVVIACVYWQSQNLDRFVMFAAVVAICACLKVRLPGMTGTISISFVPLLVAIVDFSVPEVVFLSTIAAVLQCTWRPLRRPTALQVFFNSACLGISAMLSFGVCRMVFGSFALESLVAALIVAALALYVCNTVLVTAMLCLIDGKPLYSVWRQCSFWSLSYYMVGAAAAGMITATLKASGGQSVLLVVPVMALVYICYRAHVTAAVSRQVPA